jgi:predicted AAA+ superfamily ATPase
MNPESGALSFFLFWPRSTGKFTLLQSLLPPDRALWLDLLDVDLERRLSGQPSALVALLEQEKRSPNRRPWVVIDEVQKVPDLLSIVHQCIQKKEFRFALTGSSARKLRRGGADLLGGRASWFELERADRIRFLKSYCNVYLKEEIVAEQLVRKVQPFRNFLELAALQNSQIVNYAKFAKDCGVDITTIQTYFEILQDTLIGFELQPFDLSVRKRQRKNPKFFFFDTGVTRALAGQLELPLLPRTFAYGKVFEQFVITEIFRLMKAFEKDWRMSYLTTKDGAEIDLILEIGRSSRIAIEIKSSDRVDEMEVRAFERLAGDISEARLLFVSNDPLPQRYGRVECLYWRAALAELF